MIGNVNFVVYRVIRQKCTPSNGTEVFAKAGAGFYQIVSNTTKLKYLSSFFDDPYDQEMMKLGFDYYDRTH